MPRLLFEARAVDYAEIEAGKPSVAFFERPRMKRFRIAALFAFAGIFPKEGASRAIVEGVLPFAPQIVSYGLSGLNGDNRCCHARA
jgi:hypothetical protein